MDEEINGKSKGCKTEFTGQGLEIKGDCAEGLLEVLMKTFGKSEEINSEMFGIMCINPKNGEAEKVVIGDVGKPRSVSTGGLKDFCEDNKTQLSYHTHPTSGKSKFSPQDGKVVVDRINKGYEEGHCVVGEKKPLCLLKTELEK